MGRRRPRPEDPERDLVTYEEMAMQAERQRVSLVSVATPPKKRKNMKAVGTRVERIISKMLEAIPGVRAHRVPGSGSFESMPHDVIATWGGRETTFECKARRTSGWKTLEKWRDGSDVLVLWEINHPDRARVFIDLDHYVSLVASAAQEK